MQSYFVALILTWIILGFVYASVPGILDSLPNKPDQATRQVVRGVIIAFYLISFAYSVAGALALFIVH